MLRIPMVDWKRIVATYALTAVICVACGAIVAFAVVPFYIWLDVIHNWGMMPPPNDALGAEDMKLVFSILLGSSFVMAVGFTLARDQPLLALLVGVLFCPLGWGSLFAVFLTDDKGIWYRGLFNGIAFLSLPVLQWLFACNIIISLRQKKILR